MYVSKWKQYKILSKDKEIVPFLPKTAPLTVKRLWQMIDQYSEVIIKPKRGRLGRRVIRLALLENNQFQIHSEDKLITVNGRDETFAYLTEQELTEGFIVQHAIPLATINHCPFVIHLIVQRRSNSSTWVTTGMLARVASEGYFITSVTNQIIPVETAIESSSLHDVSFNDLICEINHVVLLAANRFFESYPSCQLIGMDIGIDIHGDIWILDADFNPMITLFKWLDDPGMYERIKSYL